jgi:hypothetical protein
LRNWREVATRWQNFITTPVGKAFLIYQAEHDKAIQADAELSFMGGDPKNEHIRTLHRTSEKSLDLFIQEIEIILNNQKNIEDKDTETPQKSPE